MAQRDVLYTVGAKDFTKKTLRNIEQRFAQIGRAATVALTASTAALTALTVRGLKTADALGKVSDKLGETPAKLQAFNRAAELTGVATKTAELGLQRMVRRIAEAAQGSGEAQGALRELGLDAQRLSKLTPTDQFAELAKAMEGVDNQSDKVRLSFKLFDSEGVSLVNSLALGEQGLKDIRQELDDYGLALTRIDIAKIEAANDAFFRAKSVVAGFGQQFAAQVAPILEEVANRFLDAAKEAGGVGNVAQETFQKLVNAAGFAADAINGLKVVWLGVKTVAISALAAPIALLAELEASVLNLLNLLPGVGITTDTAISNISSGLVGAAVSAQEEFAAALLAPPPSEAIKSFIDPIIVESQRLAEEAALKAAERVAIGGVGEDGGESQQIIDDEAAVTAAIESEAKRRARAEKQWTKTAIDSRRDLTTQGLGFLATLAGGSKKAAKALLLVEAGRGISQAIINSQVAATRALAELGPIAGPPVAAKMIAYGKISAGIIAANAALKLGGAGAGGGGGLPGGSASTDTQVTSEPIPELTQAPPVINIDFSGGITDTNAVREFIENDFAEALRDGSGLNVQVVAV